MGSRDHIPRAQEESHPPCTRQTSAPAVDPAVVHELAAAPPQAKDLKEDIQMANRYTKR